MLPLDAGLADGGMQRRWSGMGALGWVPIFKSSSTALAMSAAGQRFRRIPSTVGSHSSLEDPFEDRVVSLVGVIRAGPVHDQVSDADGGISADGVFELVDGAQPAR